MPKATKVKVLMKNKWALLLGIPVVIYGLILLGLYTYQEKIIFPGTALADDYRFEYNVPFSELTIPVNGGALNALHFSQKNPRGLIFFLHGNSGNLTEWATDIDFYQRVNYDLFIIDYRGYGKSTGTIESQQQLHNDVRAAWNIIAPDFTDKPIVIYGRSLGTALAVQLASEVKPQLLILVSAFSNLKNIAKALYPYAPSWLLRYPLETDKLIQQVPSDILFIHGDKDRLIPIGNSQHLQKLTQKPSTLHTIDGAGHNNIHQFSSYLESLEKALP